MKKCPNCGASLAPYMVRCEYCRSWVFDWNVLLKDGEKCYAAFVLDNGRGEKHTLTTLAIPRVETIQMDCNTIGYSDILGCRHNVYAAPSFEICTTFRSMGEAILTRH